MPLLSSIFRSVYSVELRSSQDQLRDDFGEFPPVPLQCKSLTGHFNVVRTRGIGDAWHDALTNFRLFRLPKTAPLSTDLLTLVGIETARNLREANDTLGRTAPAFGALMLGVKFFARVAKEAWRGPGQPKILACYLPVFKDEGRIVIKAGRLRGVAEGPLISHEHIHVLQHRSEEPQSKQVRSPEMLLSQEDLDRPFVLYLLEKNEAEARLHECVLSFYRAHRHLPTTLTQFLGLLASSKELGPVVELVFETPDKRLDREWATYPARELSPVEQLAHLLLCIKAPALIYGYITEVLPVMYGNLLRLYGDEVASKAFLDCVQRPNLYDELYSAPEASVDETAQ